VRFPSIFPMGVGSMIFPVALPITNTGSPLLNIIDFSSSSLTPPGFMSMLCVDIICPVTFPKIFPATVISSFTPEEVKSLMLTELVFSEPSKSSSRSKMLHLKWWFESGAS
jgi:hypothetical protein